MTATSITLCMGFVLPILPMGRPVQTLQLPRHSVPSTEPRARPLLAVVEPPADPHGRLILVRHGQSEWNKANRFTGWVGPPASTRLHPPPPSPDLALTPRRSTST